MDPKRQIVMPHYSFEELIKEKGLRYKDPFELFDRIPILELRFVCIAEMREWLRNGSNEIMAEWLETRIEELHALNKEVHSENSYQSRELGGKLLECYVANTNHNVLRALRFALKMRGKFSERDIEKLIFGRLKENPNLYWEIPEIREYVRRDLQLYMRGPDMVREYTEFDWVPIERALKVVVAAEDFSIIKILGKLRGLFENGKLTRRRLWPTKSRDLLEERQNEALIAAAMQLLCETRRRLTKEPAQCLRRFLIKRGKLKHQLTILTRNEMYEDGPSVALEIYPHREDIEKVRELMRSIRFEGYSTWLDIEGPDMTLRFDTTKAIGCVKSTIIYTEPPGQSASVKQNQTPRIKISPCMFIFNDFPQTSAVVAT